MNPFLCFQGEGGAAESPRDPEQAGPGAVARGLPGHAAHLPDRVHALGQPVWGHAGRGAAPHQGQQGRGAAALHRRRGRLRLQETPAVSPGTGTGIWGVGGTGTQRGICCCQQWVQLGTRKVSPNIPLGTSFGSQGVPRPSHSGPLSSSSTALPVASTRPCGSCCRTARSGSSARRTGAAKGRPW